MVHYARDEALAAALSNPAADPFITLASRWTGKPAAAVLPPERAWAKTVCYGLLYGKGCASLAAEMGIPVAAASALVDAFKASLPGLTAWLAATVAAARAAEPGPHVRTLSGRLRDLPRLAATGPGEAAREQRSAAERQAVNTVCQGSAADVTKTALVDVARRLAAEAAPLGPLPRPRAALVLSVHDDLVLEVYDAAGQLASVAGMVRAAMLHAGARAGLTAPLAVRLRAGPSWDALTDLD